MISAETIISESRYVEIKKLHKKIKDCFLVSADLEAIYIIDAMAKLIDGEEKTGIISRKFHGGDVLRDYYQLKDTIPEIELFTREVFAYLSPVQQRSGQLYLIKLLCALNPVFLSSFTDLFYKVIREGDAGILIDLLNSSDLNHNTFNSGLMIQYGLNSINRIIEDIETRRDQGAQSVLVNTLPKSGSMYIATKLSEGLNLTMVPVAVQKKSLEDDVVSSWTRHFIHGGCLSQEHIHPSKKNIELLKENGVNKLLVHVRDPRQSLLSMIHHVYEWFDQIRYITESFFPDSYCAMTFDERVDWMIDNYFPVMMDWINGWVVESDGKNPDFEIFLTSYEDLHDSETLFFRRILTFYGIDETLLHKFPRIRKGRKTHFRCGRKDEWRYVFSEKNARAIRNMIPDHLAERFDWI